MPSSGASADGAVPGPLAGHLEVVLRGEANRLGDVIGALDEGDCLGSLVGSQVPSCAGLVPVGVARGCDAAGDGQPGEITHLVSSASCDKGVSPVLTN